MARRWLLTGTGAISTIIGGRLLDHGEEVVFLARNRDRQRDLQHRGLTLHDAKADRSKRYHPAIVCLADLETPFDIVLLTLRRSAIDTTLCQGLRPAIDSHTLLVPMFAAFDLPRSLRETSAEAQWVYCFPTAIGGWRGAEKNTVFGIVPNRAVHLLVGRPDGTGTKAVDSVAAALRGSGLRVWRSRQVLGFKRSAAAFIVAFARQAADEPATLVAERPPKRAAIRMAGHFRQIVAQLGTSGRPVPWLIRLCSKLPQSVVGRLIQLVLAWALGAHYTHAVQGFFAHGGFLEQQQLEKDLRDPEP